LREVIGALEYEVGQSAWLGLSSGKPEGSEEMETWDAITARLNVGEYKPDPLSGDDLNRIAEAGWRAPSAKNRQAWDFVIVTDKAQLQE
jgi:hypothetical protein